MFGLKNINRCDVFIVLNILYSMQGLIYSPGFVNRLLQLMIIVWALFVSIKYLFGYNSNSKLLVATSWLVFMYTIYGGILLIYGNTFISYINELPPRYIYLQVSLRSLLPIYVFYNYAYKGYLSSDRIRLYGIILLIALVPVFYFQQSQIMLQLDRDEITNNMGYSFLSLLPLYCFYYKNNILQYILLSIALLFIIMAMKRGAIVISVICIGLIIYGNLFVGDNKRKIFNLFLSSIVVVGAIYFILHMLATSDYFALRLEQTLSGNSSGRDDLYNDILQSVKQENNVFYLLFGRGADSTWGVAGNYAHQDWLETLCNNGLIGVFLLFNFYFSLFRNMYFSRKLFIKPLYISYMILFITSFSKTLFSMSIQNMDIAQSLLIGYFSYWTTVSRGKFKSL